MVRKRLARPFERDRKGSIIAVDDFAEVEVPGLQPLTRQEFRDVCNASRTKAQILEALGQ